MMLEVGIEVKDRETEISSNYHRQLSSTVAISRVGYSGQRKNRKGQTKEMKFQ
jgi:hypothetical protein